MISQLAITLREEVLEDLQAVSAGMPLCKISASGINGQEVKYFEGRYASLTEIVNGAAVDSRLQEWQEQHAHAHSSHASVGWIQYFGGGVDALMELKTWSETTRD